MGWRERQGFFPPNEQDRLTLLQGGYQHARFKDAPFWVRRSSLDGGRRQSIQRFPGQVYTNVQDLGRDSSQLTIEAFLVGEDYDRQREHLESRLLEGGAGVLVLPWRAPFEVTVVDRIRVNESKERRGYATIEFTVVETAPPPKRTNRDSVGRVAEAGDAARDVTAERFGRRFSIEEQPETFRTRVRSAIDEGADRIVAVQRKVDAFIAEAPTTLNQIVRLSGLANDLINTPLDLHQEIVNGVVSAYSALRSPLETAQQVIETWGRGGPVRVLADTVFGTNQTLVPVTVDTTNELGRQEQQNLNELNRAFRLNFFYEMARVLPDLPFESRRQAIALRADWVREIDPLFEEATAAEAEAMLRLNEAVGAFLEVAANEAPELSTYTPNAVLPALVIAQEIYGDATLEADIVIRNNIVHPGFVPDGEPLEVLNAGQ